jgi:hypothetical protein
MASEIYATLAHVLPILLLALMWDSEYLVLPRRQQRLPRRIDPAGVRFWIKQQVRIYALFVTGETVVSTAVAILVLARVIPDSRALRIALSASAPKPQPDSAAPDSAAPDTSEPQNVP